MGEPVKIKDLAKGDFNKTFRIWTRHRYKIKYTGLRPGEKLYEEILNGWSSVN